MPEQKHVVLVENDTRGLGTVVHPARNESDFQIKGCLMYLHTCREVARKHVPHAFPEPLRKCTEKLAFPSAPISLPFRTIHMGRLIVFCLRQNAPLPIIQYIHSAHLPRVQHQILSAKYQSNTGVLRIQTCGCVLRLQLSKKYPIPRPCITKESTPSKVINPTS